MLRVKIKQNSTRGTSYPFEGVTCAIFGEL